MPAMKRLGKPDTGNPFVRFDEGRVWIRELTTSVGSIPPIQTRLLYRGPDSSPSVGLGQLAAWFYCNRSTTWIIPDWRHTWTMRQQVEHYRERFLSPKARRWFACFEQ